MDKNRKRRLWLLLILLLFLPPCYYMHSALRGRKAQVERERLLVKRQIRKPVLREEGVWDPPVGVILHPPAPKKEEPKLKPLKRIEVKRRKPVVVPRKEAVRKEQKPAVPMEPKEKPPTVPECVGVPISHRNAAFFFSRGLNLGSDLSYVQTVMALRGLGISPEAGWNQGDPQFPMGADELGEILSEAEDAISHGLVAADSSELREMLRRYCEAGRAQLAETPRCPGPMVTECEEVNISHCDFAVYVCQVLGIAEELKCDQAFLALAALHIAPERGWRFEDPFALITQREIEEVRCSVQDAYRNGLIETEPAFLVASVNDYCLWLRMNIEVTARSTVAEVFPLPDYRGGGEVFIPTEGIVASASQ